MSAPNLPRNLPTSDFDDPEELRTLLMEGLRSGPSRPFDQSFIDEMQDLIDAAADLPTREHGEAFT